MFKSPSDGWRHLAASVIERAVLDANDPEYRRQSEVREWLVTCGYIWAEWAYPEVDRRAVQEEMVRKYG